MNTDVILKGVIVLWVPIQVILIIIMVQYMLQESFNELKDITRLDEEYQKSTCQSIKSSYLPKCLEVYNSQECLSDIQAYLIVNNCEVLE